MLAPQKAFEYYRAMKLHFTTDQYDFSKYNGAIKAPSYLERPEAHLYDRLAREYGANRIVPFLVANNVTEPGFWIMKEGTKNIYHHWLGKVENLPYTIKRDMIPIIKHCKKENQKFGDLIAVNDGRFPHLLRFIIRREITAETAMILTCGFSLWKKWDEVDWLKNQSKYIEEKRRCVKYSSFFNARSILMANQGSIMKMF